MVLKREFGKKGKAYMGKETSGTQISANKGEVIGVTGRLLVKKTSGYISKSNQGGGPKV